MRSDCASRWRGLQKLSLATCNLSRAIQLKRATAGEFQHMKKSSLFESHGSVELTGARTHEPCICRDCLPLPVITQLQVSLFYLTDTQTLARDTPKFKISTCFIVFIPSFLQLSNLNTLRINVILLRFIFWLTF